MSRSRGDDVIRGFYSQVLEDSLVYEFREAWNSTAVHTLPDLSRSQAMIVMKPIPPISDVTKR